MAWIVGDADHLLVQVGVHMLEVVEEQVDVGQHCRDGGFRHESRGVERGVQAGFLAALEELDGKLQLAKWLAAGKRHAAP